MYQLNDNFDEKTLFGRISHFKDPKIKKNVCKGFVLESGIPRSILVHGLNAIDI